MSVQSHKTSGIRRALFAALILLAYATYAMYSYGLRDGASVTVLTWSFFVFATPIADAGFLLAFPIRIATGLKMFYTQVLVWGIAAVAVATHLMLNANIFHKTPVLRLFDAILRTPWPLWLILILSAIGTYISVKFDDRVYDMVAGKGKKSQFQAGRASLYTMLTFFGATFALYAVLLKLTHVNIALF